MIDFIFDLQRFAGNSYSISLTGGGSYPSTSLGGSSNHINAGNGAHTVNVSLGGDSGSYEFWISNFDTDDEILFQNAGFSISGISANNDNVIVTANDNKYTVTIHGVKNQEWAIQGESGDNNPVQFSVVTLESATNGGENPFKITYGQPGNNYEFKLEGLTGASNVNSQSASLLRYSSLSDINLDDPNGTNLTVIVPTSILANATPTTFENGYSTVLKLTKATNKSYSLSAPSSAGYTTMTETKGESWWSASSAENTFVYNSAGQTGGYSLGSESDTLKIDYYVKTTEELFGVSGVSSAITAENISSGITVGSSVVTVAESVLTTDKTFWLNTIKGGYSLSYSGTTPEYHGGWSLSAADNFSYFTDNWNTAGWSLASLSINHVSASGDSSHKVELYGISAAGLSAPKDSVVSITGNDYINNITTASIQSNTGNYSFYLYGDLSGKTFLGSESADSINVAGKNISVDGGGSDIYSLQSGAEKVTINVTEGADSISVGAGVTAFNVAGFSSDDKIIFTQAITSLSADGSSLLAVVNDSTVTIGGINNLYTTGKAWSIHNQTNAVYVDQTVAGAVSNGSIISLSGTDSVGDTWVELAGISDIKNMENVGSDNVVSLSSANYSNESTSVSVVSNTGNYSFHLSGDLSGKTFLGSESADSINVAGKNISVDGGKGSDIYSLQSGAEKVTINVTEGDDSINVNLTSGGFSVAGFSSGDKIIFGSTVAASSEGNHLVAGGVSIYGVDLSRETWSVNADHTLASYYIAEGVSLQSDNKTFDYHAKENIFSLSGALANDFTGGISQITFNNKIVNVAISALSGTTTPGTVLTLTNESGNDYKLNFGAGFTDSNKAHNAGISWAASVGSTSTYTYYSKFTTAGYSLGGDSLKIDYLAASLGSESFTISGLSSNLTASINSDGKYVTPAGVTVTNKNVSLGANALASVNVAISNSYSLYVADSLNPASLDAAWSVGSAENKPLVFNSAGYSAAGYSGVGTSNLTYHIATRNELFSLSGFTGVPFSDASNVNQTAGEVSLTSDHLTQATETKITLTDNTDDEVNYKIVLYGVAAPQFGKQGWSLEGDLASYFKEDWNTAGWSLASDSLSVESLSASGQSTADVELSGIGSTNGMEPKDKVISLTSANYSSTSVSVVSNTGGYSFHLSGELSGKSFLGSESADSIVVAGKNISVDGKGGNDVYSLQSDAENVLITYNKGDGDDEIRGFNSTSKLKLGNDGTDAYTPEIDGENVLIHTGGGTIKLVGVANLFGNGINDTEILSKFIQGTPDFNGLSGNNGQYILNSNVTSATLLTAFEGTFDATQRKVDYTDPRHPEKGSEQVKLKTVGTIKVEKNFSNDVEIIGNAKKNNISSGTGDDTLHGGAKEDKLHGGNGDDKIFGDGGNDLLYGDGGDDSLEGGKGNDTLKGDKGNDTLRGGKGDDSLEGGDGKDLFIYERGDGHDVIYKYESADSIWIGNGGTDDNYSVSVKDKKVIIKVGKGSLTLKSARDKKVTINDTTNIYRTEGTYNEDETSLKFFSTFEGEYEARKTVESIDGSAATGVLNIIGNKLGNSITGGHGDDILFGDAGDDSIFGGKGADCISGGAGYDCLNGGNGFDTLIGGAGSDTLFGGSGQNLFVYEAGDDVIADFTAGTANKIQLLNDSVTTDYTIAGNDLIMYFGNDSLTVKNYDGGEIKFLDADGKEFSCIFTENILYNGAKNGATLISVNTYTADDKVATIDASNLRGEINIEGNAHHNLIIGNGTGGTLSGGAGSDTIRGGAGNDTIIGGAGSDSLWGGGGYNTFLYGAGDGSDVIYGFSDRDELLIDGIDDITADYNAEDKSIAVHCGMRSIILKDFGSNKTFYINDDTWTLSGNTLTKQ